MTLEVGDDDTAVALRSGEVPVLATPRLIALCEEASLAGHRRPGPRRATPRSACGSSSTTSPPPPSATTVTAEATLEKVEGRRLTFTVSASDERGLIAAGKVTRVVVDVEQFMDKCL